MRMEVLFNHAIVNKSVLPPTPSSAELVYAFESLLDLSRAATSK